jgi:hypothetical protein
VIARDADGGPLRIRPPLLACLRFGVVLIVAVMGVGMVFGELKRWIDGTALTEPLVLLQLGAFAIGLGLALGLSLYAAMLPWGWTVDAAGVTGRSLWGRRQCIAWNEVGNVTATAFDGIPALMIGSTDKGRDVFACTLGVDLQAIHLRLACHAGAEHPLTRAFAGAGT